MPHRMISYEDQGLKYDEKTAKNDWNDGFLINQKLITIEKYGLLNQKIFNRGRTV